MASSRPPPIISTVALHVLSGFGHADLCCLTLPYCLLGQRRGGIMALHAHSNKLLEAGLLRWKHNQHGTVRAGRKGARVRPQHPHYAHTVLIRASEHTHKGKKARSVSCSFKLRGHHTTTDAPAALARTAVAVVITRQSTQSRYTHNAVDAICGNTKPQPHAPFCACKA